MIDDIVKSIRLGLYERTTSPLFGAFAMAWAVWNYKTIVVLLSDMSVTQTFEFIERTLYPTFWAGVLNGFVYPAIAASAFLFVYPFPARYVFRFWRFQQQQLKKIRQAIEDETPLTLEESRKLLRQLSDTKNDYELELSRRNQEIQALKDTAQQRHSEQLALQKELTELRSQVQISTTQPPSIEDLTKVVQSGPFRLHFNPKQGASGSKRIQFGPDGLIVEGRNDNEHRWRVVGDRLELVQADSKVHSRFEYQPKEQRFVLVPGSDLGAKTQGQFIVRESGA